MKKFGFMPADILLPKKDFPKWAVVACDQFTSEADYWNAVEKTVGDAPSTLRITLPEIYLEDGDTEKRIADINVTMEKYLENGVFEEYKEAMIYVERTQSDLTVRHGIVGAIELCDYDYRKGSKALIRATEQTVIERIPPRVKIRKDASVELPHVLLLTDDPEKTVIEPIKAVKDKLTVAYDFDLMQGGGHITGWFLRPEDIERVGLAVNALCDGKEDKMMFAVGDGNHSLATAKECSNLSDSPLARSALVEVVNIHDDSIQFEPIYRVLFGVEPELVIAQLAADLGTDGEDYHKFICCFGDEECELHLKPTSKLPVGTLQTWLDDYIKKYNVKIDYIHGEDVVRNLSKEKGNLGFIFDGMRKDELFPAVLGDGSLPRKTFSMGHAADKRYYIEARKIK
ncbi:MAG: DUF1015 domain-containing protein [Clostridia bacterium]|nr:DUF1015 domain-containing protein [Clostridia bacterium]